MNARVPRVLVLTLLIGGGVLALLSSPFLVAAAQNNFRSSRLAAHLASAPLPSGARVIESIGRVFNGTTLIGCHYQGLVIVLYRGDAADLWQAYSKSLELYAERFPDPKIIYGAPNDEANWYAKVWGEMTELEMSRNAVASGLYLVSLTNSAGVESFDPRCW